MKEVYGKFYLSNACFQNFACMKSASLEPYTRIMNT